MAILNKKDFNSASAGMRDTDRDAEIRRLERERLRVNLEIEELLREYSRKSGNRSLKPSRRRAGGSPNDYNYKK